MGHLTRKTDRCVIDIDSTAHRVLNRQRWQYNWLLTPGQPAWNQREREHFHKRADRMIWDVWSNRATFRVAGSSEYAKSHAADRFTASFDIQWVLSNPHWKVNVTKVPPGYMAYPTHVEWPGRQIFLCTEDFETTRHAGGIIAHEFGHAMGNTTVLGRGDEYKETSPHHGDTASVINVGRTLRIRHFRTMIEEMNQMAANTTWSVSQLI